MLEIKHLFHIAATREVVYGELSTVQGIASWWNSETSGDGSLGGTIELRFGPSNVMTMKVTALEPGRTVEWEFLSGANDWAGNRARFDLDENDGKTRVRFSHSGWKVQDDNYAATNFSWARYLMSLRQLCQTGQGEAFGATTYRR